MLESAVLVWQALHPVPVLFMRQESPNYPPGLPRLEAWAPGRQGDPQHPIINQSRSLSKPAAINGSKSSASSAFQVQGSRINEHQLQAGRWGQMPDPNEQNCGTQMPGGGADKQVSLSCCPYAVSF